MKKVVLIVFILVAGLFLLIFDVGIGPGSELKFIDNYQTGTGHDDFLVEEIYSTDSDEQGLRVTLIDCDIDSANLDSFKRLSKIMAAVIQSRLNDDDQYHNIIMVFKPENPEGIRLSENVTVDDFSVTYKAEDLK